jgi:hypothetical protein
MAYVPWPNFDPELALDNSQEYVVQVNGKKYVIGSVGRPDSARVPS